MNHLTSLSRPINVLLAVLAILAFLLWASVRLFWPAPLSVSEWRAGLFPLQLQAQQLSWTQPECAVTIIQLSLRYESSALTGQAERVDVERACLDAASNDQDHSSTTESSALPNWLNSAMPAWLPDLRLGIEQLIIQGLIEAEVEAERAGQLLTVEARIAPMESVAIPPFIETARPVELSVSWDLASTAFEFALFAAEHWYISSEGTLTPQLAFQQSGQLTLKPSDKQAYELTLPFDLSGDLSAQRLTVQGGKITFAEQQIGFSKRLALSWPSYELQAEAQTQINSDISAQLQFSTEGKLDSQDLLASALTGEFTAELSQQAENSPEPNLTMTAAGPWQLSLSPIELLYLPDVGIREASQSLSTSMQGELRADPKQLSLQLGGALQHPQIQDTQAEIQAELVLSELTYQGNLTTAGKLAAQPAEFSLETSFRGDPNQVALEFLPAKSRGHWQLDNHRRISVAVTEGSRGRVRFADEVHPLQVTTNLFAQLDHPYGQGDLSAQVSFENHSLTGEALLQTPFVVRESGTVAEGDLSTQVKMDGTLQTPGVTLDSLVATANLLAPGDLQVEELKVAMRKPYQLMGPEPSSQTAASDGKPLEFQLTADYASLAGDDLPLPELTVALEPMELTQPVGFVGDYSQGQIAGQYDIAKQSLTAQLSQLALSPFAHLVDPVLTLQGGEVSGEIGIQNLVDEPHFQAALVFSDIQGEYVGNLFEQVDTTLEADGMLEKITAQGQLAAGLLYTGVPIQEMSTQWHIALTEAQQQIDVSLSELSATILGGQLQAEQLRYPASENQLVSLTGLDLQQATAMQTDPVIALEGLLDLNLPVRLGEPGVAIEQGRIVNRGPISLLITDPSILDQYSKANPVLASVLDPLKQMQINLFSATVTMAEDGEADIDAKIHGRNPNQTRPVHVNYRHQENFLELLKSLRMSDSFQKQIEQQINQQYP